MKATTIQFIETYVLINCANCGVGFAITDDFQERRRKDHEAFYCPSGHKNYYTTESEEEKLKKKLAAEEKARKRAEETRDWWKGYAGEVEESREVVKKTLATTRGQLTKTKKRIAASVCPCCNRSFPNDKLHQHIHTKHPDFLKEEEGDGNQ